MGILQELADLGLDCICPFERPPGGDATDLTDGNYWQPENKSGFWSDRGTVGWSWGGSVETSGALITFDLERLCAISAVGFDSAADTITLRHTARSREGLARGALKAAQWIAGKQGFFEFSDALFGKRGED